MGVDSAEGVPQRSDAVAPWPDAALTAGVPGPQGGDDGVSSFEAVPGPPAGVRPLTTPWRGYPNSPPLIGGGSGGGVPSFAVPTVGGVELESLRTGSVWVTIPASHVLYSGNNQVHDGAILVLFEQVLRETSLAGRFDLLLRLFREQRDQIAVRLQYGMGTISPGSKARISIAVKSDSIKMEMFNLSGTVVATADYGLVGDSAEILHGKRFPNIPPSVQALLLSPVKIVPGQLAVNANFESLTGSFIGSSANPEGLGLVYSLDVEKNLLWTTVDPMPDRDRHGALLAITSELSWWAALRGTGMLMEADSHAYVPRLPLPENEPVYAIAHVPQGAENAGSVETVTYLVNAQGDVLALFHSNYSTDGRMARLKEGHPVRPDEQASLAALGQVLSDMAGKGNLVRAGRRLFLESFGGRRGWFLDQLTQVSQFQGTPIDDGEFNAAFGALGPLANVSVKWEDEPEADLGFGAVPLHFEVGPGRGDAMLNEFVGAEESTEVIDGADTLGGPREIGPGDNTGVPDDEAVAGGSGYATAAWVGPPAAPTSRDELDSIPSDRPERYTRFLQLAARHGYTDSSFLTRDGVSHACLDDTNGLRWIGEDLGTMILLHPVEDLDHFVLIVLSEAEMMWLCDLDPPSSHLGETRGIGETRGNCYSIPRRIRLTDNKKGELFESMVSAARGWSAFEGSGYDSPVLINRDRDRMAVVYEVEGQGVIVLHVDRGETKSQLYSWPSDGRGDPAEPGRREAADRRERWNVANWGRTFPFVEVFLRKEGYRQSHSSDGDAQFVFMSDEKDGTYALIQGVGKGTLHLRYIQINRRDDSIPKWPAVLPEWASYLTGKFACEFVTSYFFSEDHGLLFFRHQASSQTLVVECDNSRGRVSFYVLRNLIRDEEAAKTLAAAFEKRYLPQGADFESVAGVAGFGDASHIGPVIRGGSSANPGQAGRGGTPPPEGGPVFVYLRDLFSQGWSVADLLPFGMRNAPDNVVCHHFWELVRKRGWDDYFLLHGNAIASRLTPRRQIMLCIVHLVGFGGDVAGRPDWGFLMDEVNRGYRSVSDREGGEGEAVVEDKLVKVPAGSTSARNSLFATFAESEWMDAVGPHGGAVLFSDPSRDRKFVVMERPPRGNLAWEGVDVIFREGDTRQFNLSDEILRFASNHCGFDHLATYSLSDGCVEMHAYRHRDSAQTILVERRVDNGLKGIASFWFVDGVMREQEALLVLKRYREEKAPYGKSLDEFLQDLGHKPGRPGEIVAELVADNPGGSSGSGGRGGGGLPTFPGRVGDRVHRRPAVDDGVGYGLGSGRDADVGLRVAAFVERPLAGDAQKVGETLMRGAVEVVEGNTVRVVVDRVDQREPPLRVVRGGKRDTTLSPAFTVVRDEPSGVDVSADIQKVRLKLIARAEKAGLKDLPALLFRMTDAQIKVLAVRTDVILAGASASSGNLREAASSLNLSDRFLLAITIVFHLGSDQKILLAQSPSVALGPTIGMIPAVSVLSVGRTAATLVLK